MLNEIVSHGDILIIVSHGYFYKTMEMLMQSVIYLILVNIKAIIYSDDKIKSILVQTLHMCTPIYFINVYICDNFQYK